MSRSAYYHEMKQLARAMRSRYGLTTPRVLRSDLRRIYRDQGIHIDLWPHKLRQVRGGYFNDDCGATVLLAKGLPEDPMVFTMAHELKHHLVDQHLLVACCSERNVNEHIEIGAEIFAAEFIFPEEEFVAAMEAIGVRPAACTPEALVRLKRETRTTLSYTGLAKRATFLGFASSGTLDNIAWKKLEEAIYGEPLYKRLLRSRGHQ